MRGAHDRRERVPVADVLAMMPERIADIPIAGRAKSDALTDAERAVLELFADTLATLVEMIRAARTIGDLYAIDAHVDKMSFDQ